MITEEIVHINGIPKKLIVFLHGYQDTAEHIERKTTRLRDLSDVALHIPQAPFFNEVDAEKRHVCGDVPDAGRKICGRYSCVKV